MVRPREGSGPYESPFLTRAQAWANALLCYEERFIGMESHPGPASVVLPPAVREAIIAHARAGEPLEACGVIVGDRPAAEGGRPLRFEPARNAAESRYLYELDADDLLRLTIATDDADEVFWAIVHSHTHTPAVPSATDRRLAFYPDSLYILASLAPGEADPKTGAESVRAWRIVEDEIFEVAIR